MLECLPGQLEIIDGSQRLRTIEEFILGDFVLGDLDELSLLAGFKFDDLSEARQRKIKNRSIRGIILNEKADERHRFELFDRINTGPKIANKAEIRRGALGGPFLDLVIDLSKSKPFVDLAPVPHKKEKEREREELITRFFAYGDGLEDYKDRVADFLYKYTRKMNSEFAKNPEDVDAYRQRFDKVMDFILRNFPWGFRKTRKGKTSPRARFEAISIGSYRALQQKPSIFEKRFAVEDWHDSKDFKKVTGADGANAKGRLNTRINYVRDRLLGD